MADGYARLSGKPGVALVITGPGLTNTITAMGQAREDSVPMLVISGVNARATLGHGRGHLHELPDQQAMLATVALMSHTLTNPDDLADVIDRAFSILLSRRPGPVHIEIPTDVMAARIAPVAHRRAADLSPAAPPALIRQAAELCRAARAPVVLCGGGAVSSAAAIRQLAEAIDAPVVTTVNARGMFFGHELSVPASPSLGAVRRLIADADLVLAFGTEFGQTDYDMYGDKGFPEIARLVRVDIDADQLARGPRTEVAMLSTVESAIGGLLGEMDNVRRRNEGARRAEETRQAAWAELPPKLKAEVRIVETIRDTLDQVVIVGDSTQAVYAGNLYYDAGRPHGWFNAATGFGALGYGPPAAIGAAIAEPQTPVVCLTGDGGFQFSLAEIGSASDAGARVIFLVWNNDGYQEIETYMIDNAITPEGVKPSAPDFLLIAKAYGLPAVRLTSIGELAAALREMAAHDGPSLIEIHEVRTSGIFD
jgi:acetolactate synthase-1/2/3 large subunit